LNEGSGAWDGTEAWRVVEEFRIVEAGPGGTEPIAEIRAIAVAPDSAIFLFDHFAGRLTRFSSSGEPEESFGRQGAGPGEFRSVVGMALAPNEELWIVDGLNRRYTVLDREGEVRTVPRTPEVVARPWLGGFDAEGRLHERDTRIEGGALVDLIVRIDPEGAVEEGFRLPTVPNPNPTLGGGVMVPIPFMPSVLRAWGPAGGVWHAVSSEYRITKIGPAGDTVLVASRGRDPLTLARAEQDSLARAVRQAEQHFGIAVDEETLPTSIGPLRWFTVDDGGHLWVCASGRDPCGELDVMGPSGRLLGTVPLPAPVLGTPLPVIRNGRFHAVVEGPLGEPQLLVGSLIMPPAESP
jgi:hypothetical protein